MNRILGWGLAAVALVAIVLLLTQSQSLSQTQATLSAARSTSTAQAGAMADQLTAISGTVVAAATQVADEQQQTLSDAQNQASTAQAAAVSDAQNSAATSQAQVVNELGGTATANVISIVALATSQAATLQANASQAVADAQNAGATAQAQALIDAEISAATIQAQAVSDAQNSAATVQAAQLADAESAHATELYIHEQNFNTLQSIGATRQAHVLTLEAQLSAFQPTLPPDIDVTPTEQVASATLIPGWQRVVGRGVALQVPNSFRDVSQSFNTSLMADNLRSLGAQFEPYAILIEQNPDLLRLMAVDTRNKGSLMTNVIVFHYDLPDVMTVESIVNIALQNYPSSIKVIENTIVEIGSYEVGRIMAENNMAATSLGQVEYFFVQGRSVWEVAYTTTADEFEARQPTFDQSIQTIEFLPEE